MMSLSLFAGRTLRTVGGFIGMWFYVVLEHNYSLLVWLPTKIVPLDIYLLRFLCPLWDKWVLHLAFKCA